MKRSNREAKVQDSPFNYSSREACARRQHGAVIVEAAMLLPALVLMFMLCWDTFVVVLSDLRHRSAMVQIALNYRMTPIRAQVTYDPVTFDPAISYFKRTGTELANDPASMLDRLNVLYNEIMVNIGTGSEFVDSNIMSQLIYFDIHEQSDTVNGVTGGDAYGWSVADSINGYSAPGPGGDPNVCFGTSLTPYQNRLTAYAGGIANKVTTPGVGAPTRPVSGSPLARFGTKLFDIETEGVNPYIPNTPLYQLSLGSVELFLPMRAVIFYLMCSQPPRFFGGDPVITPGFFMLDKEVSLE